MYHQSDEMCTIARESQVARSQNMIYFKGNSSFKPSVDTEAVRIHPFRRAPSCGETGARLALAMVKGSGRGKNNQSIPLIPQLQETRTSSRMLWT